jgi:hypothetical protein
MFSSIVLVLIGAREPMEYLLAEKNVLQKPKKNSTFRIFLKNGRFA